ncbi:DUF6455 family protein [Solemya velum gill symbiont]|uniref:DUF6455 domain-containing protein n=2 Tax=Solemya velum gill symbiont TaxID=2340 RepID=A0A0B0H5S1_SOVGS|nr:DUF6455 family protein [Solemya velum gill symbiont]KHF24440.1 hypothetical protein JV46_28230 [Solemya velum gill symbiont]OOY34931.1 hypothetical protein BOV88_07370 [Solemya velum gill symbiont]OOY37316.1 hypothetical protein BOV89_07955 [Solemya velum gill symbiont]OOY40296.1 hypothetical protein BOV90_04765 [Solemya velum gill symbiont]OOY43727.1 hypothetical protein BOV92_10555 [Solemya velum gill symbiont]
MEIGSMLGVLVLALLVLAVALVMPYAIARNLVTGHTYRNQLDKGLDSLRISNMLGFLGINRSEYLHTQHGVDIQTHMEKCDACEDKELCDDVLSEERQEETDLGFCANIDDLKRIEEEQKGSAAN